MKRVDMMATSSARRPGLQRLRYSGGMVVNSLAAAARRSSRIARTQERVAREAFWNDPEGEQLFRIVPGDTGRLEDRATGR